MYGDDPSFKCKHRLAFPMVRSAFDYGKMQRVLNETLMADKERNQKKMFEMIYNKLTVNTYDVFLIAKHG